MFKIELLKLRNELVSKTKKNKTKFTSYSFTIKIVVCAK